MQSTGSAAHEDAAICAPQTPIAVGVASIPGSAARSVQLVTRWSISPSSMTEPVHVFTQAA